MWITSFPSAPGWIVHALDALPDRVDKKTKARAGAHLVATFSPRSLRILGRRVLDVVAPRSPRTTNTAGRRPRTRTPRGPPGGPTTQRLGHAFGAFLEAVDPTRLPLHGGDATTIIVTTGYQTLRDGLGTAYLGDQPIGPGHLRRLAGTADILPAVLGTDSEVLLLCNYHHHRAHDDRYHRATATSASRCSLAAPRSRCRGRPPLPVGTITCQRGRRAAR
jgi:hypothetical protein